MEDKVNKNPIFIILFSVFLSVVGQLLLKKGMNSFGAVSFASIPEALRLFGVFGSPFIICGLACYLASTIFWLVILAEVELSFAYPMVSMSYVIIAFFSLVFLGEHINFYRWLGIIFISMGIVVISRTGSWEKK